MRIVLLRMIVMGGLSPNAEMRMKAKMKARSEDNNSCESYCPASCEKQLGKDASESSSCSEEDQKQGGQGKDVRNWRKERLSSDTPTS